MKVAFTQEEAGKVTAGMNQNNEFLNFFIVLLRNSIAYSLQQRRFQNQAFSDQVSLGWAKPLLKSERVVFIILQYVEAQWNVGRLLTTVIL